MKRSRINQIIKEEVERGILMEGILDSLIMMFIKPKLKKDIKKLKNSPEWIEMELKTKLYQKEIESYNKQLERYLKEIEKNKDTLTGTAKDTHDKNIELLKQSQELSKRVSKLRWHK